MTDSPAIPTARTAPIWLPIGAAGVVLLLDQATKWLVIRALGPGEPEHRVELIGSALAVHYVQNSGAAFGLFRGQTALLTAIALLVVGGLVVSYARHRAPSLTLALGLGLLIGGAFGNLIDRLRFGYVVDFVSVGIWPKFNVADSAITVGVALLGLHLLRDGQPRRDADARPDHRERRPVAVDAER
ncbi:MAG: signal peptidase II [Thermomicrobiales bacterium]